MSFLFRKVEDVTTISKSQSLTSVSIKDCTLRVPNKTTTLFLNKSNLPFKELPSPGDSIVAVCNKCHATHFFQFQAIVRIKFDNGFVFPVHDTFALADKARMCVAIRFFEQRYGTLKCKKVCDYVPECNLHAKNTLIVVWGRSQRV